MSSLLEPNVHRDDTFLRAVRKWLWKHAESSGGAKWGVGLGFVTQKTVGSNPTRDNFFWNLKKKKNYIYFTSPNKTRLRQSDMHVGRGTNA